VLFFQVQVIFVEDELNVDSAEGARLTDDLVIGKQLAGGAQVRDKRFLTGCCKFLISEKSSNTGRRFGYCDHDCSD
jgi:hypothetical protein